ncbi:unnamed protein product [Effrenium voratum]|uniref:Peptidase M28 domain-containing protein n=1 Tax=Effrenium voratum TaxID=2562239 RepID=A0AA36NA63_9DINO|nr:unnamed protein product [Effrenium voratum]
MRAVLSLVTAVAATSELPRINLNAKSMLEGKWWAQVGDHVVHTPHAKTGLSSNVGDYYYAYGSHAALSQELQEKRVAGAGRVHIFHLPEGKDALSTALPKVSHRRDSVSALVQLSHKVVLSDAKLFPDFNLPEDYASGLSASGQQKEKQVTDSITSSALMQKLKVQLADMLLALGLTRQDQKELTELGDGSTHTRSYSNPKATANAVSFLEKEFQEMGYRTCRQTFGDQADVVAFLPGSDADSGSVTVGAHYDSRPFEGLAPGAVDNGSGATAVLEIAKAFAAAGVRPKKTIMFVCFAAEEPGLLGSAEFAKRLSSAAASSFVQDGMNASSQLVSRMCGSDSGSLAFMQAQSSAATMRRRSRHEKHEALVMDEVAWKSPNIDDSLGAVVNLESYDWATEPLKHLAGASRAANGERLKVTHSSNPFGSDHMSFLEKGMQSVLSIHGDDENYPHYHQSSDAMDQVNSELYTMIAKMNAGAAIRLAGHA